VSDLVLDSLRRRMRAMHSLWEQATETMGPEHVNHFERDGVLPIAFSLFHFVNIEDTSMLLISGTPPIWNESWHDRWHDRLKLGVLDHGKHRTVDEMVAQRLGDYAEYCEYQRAVFAKTEGWLAEVDPTALLEVVVPRPFPPQIASTYSARVAADGAGITRLDAVECWIYQHGLRHMGEIEHARALVGLGGMTS
jgi:hypothetical protein